MKRSYSATARDRLLGSAAGNSPTTPRTAVGTGFPDHASGGFKTGSVAQGPAHPAKETRNLNQIRALQVSLIEKAIFDVAYITIHDNEFPPRASWFLAFVEDLQWLSFIFSQSVFTDLPFWLAVATEPVRALTDYSLFSAANVAVLSLVYVTIALTISVSYFMHAEAKIPMIALRLLRWLITLLLTALSIPCLTILIGGLNCGGRIAAFNVNCATVPHLPLVILNALALLLYLPLLIVGSLVFTETSPTSENPLAKAHGRVDCLAVCLRILLVVLAEFALPSNNSGAWAHIVLVALGLVYQAWKSTTTLPYFEVRMNMLRSGMATAGVTSAIGAIIIKALVGSSNTAKSSQGWWPLLFAAAAVGLVGGAWVTRWTTKRYLSTTIRVWHHICREETAAARDAAAGISADPSSASLAKAHAPGRAGKPGAVVTTLGGLPTQAGATHTQTTPGLPFNGTAPAAGEGVHVSGSASIRGTISRSAIGSGGANQSTAHNPLSGTMQRAKEDTDFVVSNLLRGASNELLSTVHERQPKRRSRVFDSPLYVEVCIRFIRDNPTNKQVALGLQLLERGLVEFPKEPLLLLLASTYLAAFYGDEGLAAADVLMGDLGGTRGGVPLDVKFLAFSRDRALRDRGAHLLDRAAMESLEREVRLHHLRALYTVRDIWELVRITSSLPRVAEAVTRLAEHMAGANVSYAKLIERNPRDKQLLRAYSQYLVFVEADAVRAAQVLEIAEDVEMQESRNHREAFGDHGNTTLERTGGVDSPPPELDDAAFKGKPGIAQTIAEESEGSMVRTAPSIQTKGLVGESGDAVDPRRILWREQRPQDRPHAHSQDSFDSPAKMSPTGGRNRLSGSQTSGTSASRVERHKANMRRVLNERVIRPLRTVRIVLTFGFLFFVATLIGFIVCLQMFNATVDVLQNQFATSRTARRLVSVVLENVRLMVFNNLLGAQADFNTALAALKANIAILSTQLLPVVAQSWNYLKTPPPLFRVYKALLSPTSVDYQALSYNALQISQTVVQAGQTALVYANFGQLTPDIFSNAPELRVFVLI
ncbi:hypothetical protein BC828DRAFT_103844 [Blastocladiella britannica]|nr:hypothetical protein BC828DRAFT_103844 [Blastocladiella britannica]